MSKGFEIFINRKKYIVKCNSIVKCSNSLNTEISLNVTMSIKVFCEGKQVYPNKNGYVAEKIMEHIQKLINSSEVFL